MVTLIVVPTPQALSVMKNLSAFALIAVSLFVSLADGQSDAALRTVTEKDATSRDARGKLSPLTAAEHAARAQVYLDNREFPEAREHAQQIIELYPTAPEFGHALFIEGRSYMWEREYAKAIPYLDRVAKEFPGTKDGREALAFSGA